MVLSFNSSVAELENAKEIEGKSNHKCHGWGIKE
jgi:hypothetical protein